MDNNPSTNEDAKAEPTTHFPTDAPVLRELLKDEPPAIIEAMVDSLRAEIYMNARSDHPIISGVMVAARQIRDMRRELEAAEAAVAAALTESENRQTSLFGMIEDQVRAACRQEIEDEADDWVTARQVATIVHDMVANDDITVPVDGLASQVRTVIEEMVGDGELTVDTEVSSYVMLN